MPGIIATATPHVHYVDFFQESEGMPRLLEAMDKGRVDHVMLSGVAVAKKWHRGRAEAAALLRW